MADIGVLAEISPARRFYAVNDSRAYSATIQRRKIPISYLSTESLCNGYFALNNQFCSQFHGPLYILLVESISSIFCRAPFIHHF